MHKINHAEYSPGLNNPEAKYGLPAEVRFCKTCVISNQRPNSSIEFKNRKDTKKATIRLDENGICDACHNAEHKRTHVDWRDRERELRVLCDRFRSTDGSYDCLVPGSGGKDSVYAAHVLKYTYGMNPLTVTWAPAIYTDWGWKNQQAWIHSGFDNHLVTANGRIHRLLTRLAIENLFFPFQPFTLGQKNMAPRMAATLGIPLVFYGESEAEYGNPKQDSATPKRDLSYFSDDKSEEVVLGGVSLRQLDEDYGVKPGQLELFLPSDPERIERAGVEVHYLGYYLKWHPQSCYYYAVENCGFQASPERTAGTFSKYNSIDDKLDDFHYYTTWIKFGIGRATYDAAQEIRSGDINREEGKALVRKFDGEFPERFAEELFNYLSLPENEFPIASRQLDQPIMDRAYFDNLSDHFRSPHLWKYEDGEWKLRHTVYETDA